MYTKQSIDDLIQGVKAISMNRCSLSDDEVNLLTECVSLLEEIKGQKSMALQKRCFTEAMEILLRFFINDDIQNWMDHFK